PTLSAPRILPCSRRARDRPVPCFFWIEPEAVRVAGAAWGHAATVPSRPPIASVLGKLGNSTQLRFARGAIEGDRRPDLCRHPPRSARGSLYAGATKTEGSGSPTQRCRVEAPGKSLGTMRPATHLIACARARSSARRRAVICSPAWSRLRTCGAGCHGIEMIESGWNATPALALP